MQVMYLKRSPEEAYRTLISGNSTGYLPFRYVVAEPDKHIAFYAQTCEVLSAH